MVMNDKKALRIQELRAGPKVHTLRTLSKIICDEYPEEDKKMRGNQLHGQLLCQKAMEYIYKMELKDIPYVLRYMWDT